MVCHPRLGPICFVLFAHSLDSGRETQGISTHNGPSCLLSGELWDPLQFSVRPQGIQLHVWPWGDTAGVLGCEEAMYQQKEANALGSYFHPLQRGLAGGNSWKQRIASRSMQHAACTNLKHHTTVLLPWHITQSPICKHTQTLHGWDSPLWSSVVTIEMAQILVRRKLKPRDIIHEICRNGVVLPRHFRGNCLPLCVPIQILDRSRLISDQSGHVLHDWFGESIWSEGWAVSSFTAMLRCASLHCIIIWKPTIGFWSIWQMITLSIAYISNLMLM